MCIISLFLLVICSGLAGTNGMCDQRDLSVCYPSHMQDISFPENEEELNKVCPALISYAACLKHYAKECGIENSVIIVVIEERLERFNNVLQDACSEGSKLHHDIAENLGCLKDTFVNHRNSCAWTDEVLDSSKQYLLLEEDGTSLQGLNGKDEIDWGKFFCLHRALDAACLASVATKKCGIAAKQLLLVIFQRIGHFEVSCAEGNRKGLLELMEVLQIEVETKFILQEIFSGAFPA